MADGHITVTVNARADEVAAMVSEIKRLRAEVQYARDGLTKGRTRMREDNDRLRAELAEFAPLRARGVVDADNNLDCWDTEPFEIGHDHVAALNEKDPAAMWRVVELFGRDLGPNVADKRLP